MIVVADSGPLHYLILLEHIELTCPTCSNDSRRLASILTRRS